MHHLPHSQWHKSIVFPEGGCKVGSVWTSVQTSDKTSAVKLHSSCRRVRYPPIGQFKASSTAANTPAIWVTLIGATHNTSNQSISKTRRANSCSSADKAEDQDNNPYLLEEK